MAAFTTVKTVGTAQTFSTLATWESGAPADLTTAEKSAAGTFTGSFVQGESLSFVGSGATGKFLDSDGSSYVSYGLTAGNPASGDVVTGAGGTCTLSSSTPTNVGCIWQGQQANEELTSASTLLAVAGSTSSTSAYKELTTQAGASFRDNVNVQTNALRYNASNGAAVKCTGNTTAITCSEANFHMSKLQVAGIPAAGEAAAYDGVGAGVTGQIIDFCIFEAPKTAGSGASVLVAGLYGSGNKFRNCLVVQRASAADAIVVVSNGAAAYNCTFACANDIATAPTVAIVGSYSTAQITNCLILLGDVSKAVAGGSTTFTFTTCYTDSTSSPPTGCPSITATSEVQDTATDATRDYRLKTGATSINNGTTDSTNSPIDIAGTARPSGAAYDVGCWEFVSVATGGSPLTRGGGLVHGTLIRGGSLVR